MLHYSMISQFNIKAAIAYHPIIQKVVDQLVAMAGTEPWTGGAGFYSMYLWFLDTLVIYDQCNLK